MILPRWRRRAPLAGRHLAQPLAPSSSVPTAEPDIDVRHAGELRPPHPLLMLMEARAPLEYAALLAARPWLARRHNRMAMNPLALYAIADRLAQDPVHWTRFDLRGARRWFYKVTGHAPILAAL